MPWTGLQDFRYVRRHGSMFSWAFRWVETGRSSCALPPETIGLSGVGPLRFKKCRFQVTPEIDRALMEGFLVLGVIIS
jgi:hypothetical protein